MKEIESLLTKEVLGFILKKNTEEEKKNEKESSNNTCFSDGNWCCHRLREKKPILAAVQKARNKTERKIQL